MGVWHRLLGILALILSDFPQVTSCPFLQRRHHVRGNDSQPVYYWWYIHPSEQYQ